MLRAMGYHGAMICFPYRFKGECIKYFLAVGTEKSCPQLSIAREAVKRNVPINNSTYQIPSD